jgi:hypothetical protein
MLPSADRFPPAVRGTIKVFLAILVATLAYAVADAIVRLLADRGVLAPGTKMPTVGYGYAVGAIALSYQSFVPHLRRSFRRRFIGTIGGMLIGMAFWYAPLGPVASVAPAAAVGWGLGILIDGTSTADKGAYFAGMTALYPDAQPIFGLVARSAGILFGFVAVLLVIAYVWPATEPEDRTTPFSFRHLLGRLHLPGGTRDG